MHCDDQTTVYIANNLVFYERTNHIEVDCHFIRDTVMAKRIVTSYVISGAELGDIFTFSGSFFRLRVQAEHD